MKSSFIQLINIFLVLNREWIINKCVITRFLFLYVILLCFNTLEIYTQENCTTCHSELPESKYKHIPAEESCLNCHEQISNTHPGEDKGFKLYENVPDLCYLCHDQQNVKKHLHMPTESGECMLCHSPHASNNQALLLSDPVANLCYECHDFSPPLKGHIHGPVEKGDCHSCHNPHQSDYAALLQEESSSLCLKCHSKTITTTTGKIENIGLKLKRSSFIHTALEIEGCGLCHSSHASENVSLLKNKYPSGRYTQSSPENFAVCFDCHDQDMLLKENKLTNFRTNTENLHHLHVNGLKGRSCSVCHDVHAADKEHLINTLVQFQEWKMEMNYKHSENGGSCFPGCHGEEKYNY